MELIDFDKGILPDSHQIIVQVTARDLKRIMERIVRLTVIKINHQKRDKNGTHTN